jgi:WD40 repeat protein/serine/threonine protein kinase
MAIDSVAALVRAIRESRVLDPSRSDRLQRDLARRFGQPVDLARELVRRGWLTLFQLKEIYLGRGPELTVGQYILLDLLGEGGMGRVFKAWHRRLGRMDALKIIRKENLEQPEAVRRFQREARAAASLQHPNIVTVYEADEANGVQFLAMEYVEGTDLGKWVTHFGPLPAGAACDFIRQAALGLQHAHERGLVHRDVKPANLLLSADQRTVKVLDLGLTRLGPADGRSTSAGDPRRVAAVIGTPDYMAPEQGVAGREVDTRADVYSLGCTLYYLLSGAPPFPGGSLAQKLLWHQQCEPAPLEGKCADLPPGLAPVTAKLMAKRSEDRYQSPGAAAAALAPFASAGVLPAAPVGAEAPTPTKAGTADSTVDVRHFDFDVTESAVIQRAPAPLPEGGGEVRQFAGHTGEVRGIAFSPDGKRAVSVSTDRTACVWDLATGKRDRHLHGFVGPLLCVAWSPATEPTILCGCAGKGGTKPFVYLSSLPPGQKASFRFVDVHSSPVYAVAFSPNGEQALSAGGEESGAGCDVLLWNVENGKVRRTLAGHEKPVLGVAFIPNTRHAATCSLDRTVRLWDLSTGTEEFRFPGDIEPVLAVSPAGKTLLTAGGDRSVQVWDLSKNVPQPAGELKGHQHGILGLAFAPDGRRAVSCGVDQTVRVWDLDGRKELHCFTGHTDIVYRVAVSPDGQYVLSCGKDKTARLWELPR